jgi:site-specific DNA-methyltransferase (adenine-specific)
MEIKQMSVKDIVPYKQNAKKHPARQVEHIANSIKEFGFQQPLVVDKNNVLVIGHGRLLAAKKLKMTEVPVVRADDLTEDQIKALRLADNKTNESEWDAELLGIELGDIDIDMELFGFDMSEDPKEVVEDNYEVVLPEEPKSKRGDIYQLGDHRVMCGDSTALGDVQKLLDVLGGVDLVVTDPPYNMAYEGAGNTRDRKSKRIMNDKMSSEDFREFLTAVYRNYYCVMKDGASIYVFYKELGEGVFITALSEGGLTYKQELIWVKNQIVLGGSKYQSMYEPFLMGCKGKSIKVWNGKRNQRSVIESIDFMGEDELRDAIKDLMECFDPDILREKKQTVNDLHPTMKPVRLIAKLIQNSSNPGDAVMDLFGGSGTTMIAAEQTGRKSYLMELDPKYCDVIVDRWEKFTGKTAVLLTK